VHIHGRKLSFHEHDAASCGPDCLLLQCPDTLLLAEPCPYLLPLQGRGTFGSANLNRFPNLQSLALFPGTGVLPLDSPLLPMAQLRHLAVEITPLINASHLCPLIQMGMHLEDLKLRGLALIDTAALTLLAPALQQLTGLSSLVMLHCGLGPASMIALAPALQQLTGLRQL
jgi:hypothetical protein